MGDNDRAGKGVERAVNLATRRVGGDLVQYGHMGWWLPSLEPWMECQSVLGGHSEPWWGAIYILVMLKGCCPLHIPGVSPGSPVEYWNSSSSNAYSYAPSRPASNPGSHLNLESCSFWEIVQQHARWKKSIASEPEGAGARP